MNKRIIAVILLIAVIWVIVQSEKEKRQLTKEGQASVADLFAEPGPLLKNRVAPVTVAVKASPYAEDLAYFYRRLALIIGEAKTTTQARAMHLYMGTMLAETSPYAAYHPKLLPVVEELFDTLVGRGARRLEEDDKQQLADLFMGIAWACLQASGKGDEVALSELDQVQFAFEFEQGPDFWQVKKNDNLVGGLAFDPVDDKRASEFETFEQVSALKFGAGKVPQPRGPPDDYKTGLIFDEAEYADYLKQNKPLFSDLGFMGSGEGKTRLLYRAVLALEPNAYREKQTTGDCTSHGTRNAADCSRAYEIMVLNEPEDWVEMGATEPIYGYRGHSGEGMSVYRAVKFVNEVGGVAVRKRYGQIDLSQYNSSIGTSWGRTGPPQSLVSQLSRNQITHAALVRDIYEARDAIVGGFALTVGSDVGFTSIRDRYGFAAPKGSWMHCMAWVGTAPLSDLIEGEASTEPCFLVANSWGPWNGGPKGKYSFPEGFFWIKPDVAARMVKQRQAFAVGNFDGFTPEPLANWGFSYLATEPDGFNDLLPPLGAGIVEAAIAKTVVIQKNDITTPSGGDNVDGGGGGVDELCKRCNNRGWIENADGHRSDCPNPRCPTNNQNRRIEL